MKVIKLMSTVSKGNRSFSRKSLKKNFKSIQLTRHFLFVSFTPTDLCQVSVVVLGFDFQLFFTYFFKLHYFINILCKKPLFGFSGNIKNVLVIQCQRYYNNSYNIIYYNSSKIGFRIHFYQNNI